MELIREWIGLLGFGLLALSFVLVIRWEPLIRFIGGLAKQQPIHHLIGIATFFALLLHVAAELWSVPPSSWKFVFNPRHLEMLSGFIAIGLFLISIGTAYLTLSFPKWRRFHWLFALSFFLAGYHGLIFAIHPIAVWAILVVGSLAILFLVLWHFIVLPKEALNVVAVERIGTMTYSLTLHSPSAKKNPFFAGRIVYLRFREQGFSRGWHPFSVASCSMMPNLRLVIKSLGHDTSLLGNLKPGSLVDLHGPYTEFLVPDGCDQVWIAGGVGIAPFFGLSQCLEFKRTGKVRLIYFACPEDQITQTVELDRIANSITAFHWKRVDVPLGQLPDVIVIQEEIGTLSNPYFILSGPPQFKKYIRNKLRALGISNSHILS